MHGATRHETLHLPIDLYLLKCKIYGFFCNYELTLPMKNIQQTELKVITIVPQTKLIW